MRKKSAHQKLELCVLCLLFLSFLGFYSEESKQVSYTYEYFIDLNLSNTNYNGEEPVAPNPNPNNVGPWCSFDQITWNTLPASGAIIYVFGDTSGSSFALQNKIDPQADNVTFIGVKDQYDTAYWSLAYGSAAQNYPILQAPAQTSVLDINGPDCTRFYNITFNGSAGGYTNPAVEIDYAPNSYFENCVFNSFDEETAVYIHSGSNLSQLRYCDINSEEGYAVEVDDSEHVKFHTCSMVKDVDNNSYSVIYLLDANDALINDSTTETSQESLAILEIDNCDNAYFIRNKFHIDQSDACTNGIQIINSTALTFESNSVYANCSNSAVYDDNTNDGDFAWNCNTLYNSFTSASGFDEGYGYYGSRSNGSNIETFLNNIVYASSSANKGFAIFIDCPVNYWQPSASGNLDYNCYYGDYSVNGYFGYINGTSYCRANPGPAQWQTDTGDDNNSVFEDPVLTNGYIIDPATTNTHVMNDGCYVIDVDLDIEKGERPQSSNISMGADQYFWVAYMMINCTLNTGTNPPTIEVGSAASPVTVTFDFAIGLIHYGYPTPNINPISLSNTTNFSYNGSATVFPSFGQTTILPFEFLHVAHHTSDLDLQFNYGGRTLVESFYIDAYGN